MIRWRRPRTQAKASAGPAAAAAESPGGGGSAGEQIPPVPVAERMMAEASAAHGLEHLETLVARNYLARASCEAGDLRRAQLLFEENVVGLARVLGPQDQNVMASQARWAQVLDELGDHDRAAELLEPVVAFYAGRGPQDAKYAEGARDYLGKAYRSGARFGPAAEVYATNLASRQTRYGRPGLRCFGRNGPGPMARPRAANTRRRGVHDLVGPSVQAHPESGARAPATSAVRSTCEHGHAAESGVPPADQDSPAPSQDSADNPTETLSSVIRDVLG